MYHDVVPTVNTICVNDGEVKVHVAEYSGSSPCCSSKLGDVI